MSSDLRPPVGASREYDELARERLRKQRRQKASQDAELDVYVERERRVRATLPVPVEYSVSEWDGHINLEPSAWPFYRALVDSSPSMRTIARQECEHLWYVVLQRPDNSKLTLWVNAADITSSNMNYPAVFAGNGIPTETINLQCRVDQLDRYRITLMCQHPTGREISRTFTLLDVAYTMWRRGLTLDNELYPHFGLPANLTAVYTVSPPLVTDESERLWLGVEQAIAAYLRGLAPTVDPQGGVHEPIRTAVIHMLRSTFTGGEMLRYTFGPVIYRKVDRELALDLDAEFEHRYPPPEAV